MMWILSERMQPRSMTANRLHTRTQTDLPPFSRTGSKVRIVYCKLKVLAY